ncbi:uncharacterized protein PSFLO_05628 [Pseudozyma flocculosa]|nr:uncharacterized protein PSFLO_05628 [Pseudozyma flocculosa]
MSLPEMPKGRFNIVARIEGKGPKETEELAQVLKRVVERANSDEEPNTLFYKAHRSAKDPNVLLVYEEYDNKGGSVAMDAHRAGADFQQLFKLVPTHTNNVSIEVFEGI